MSFWIILVSIAQLFYACVSVIDKFIVTSKKVSKPFVYAFYITFLSAIPIFLFLLSPLKLRIGQLELPLIENITKPDAALMAMSLVAAFATFHGLVSLYSALREADASDVIPVIGSMSAVGTFLLSFLIFPIDNRLGTSVFSNENFLIGFILMVIGTALVSKFRLNKKIFLLIVHAGFLFALKATMVKAMFLTYGFDNAFFWSRIGIILFIISIILVPRYIGKITLNTKNTSSGGGYWVIGNSILSGIAAYMVLKATDLGDVIIVQALGGLQFVFLALISFYAGKFIPNEFGEKNNLQDMIQKGISIAFIVIGFFWLFLK